MVQPAEHPLGVGDDRVALGTHIAFWYRSPEEKLSTLRSYLTAGLDAGQLCLCLMPEQDIAEVSSSGGKRFADATRSGQLQIGASEEFYFKNKKFRPNKLVQGYPELIRKAQESGYHSIRAAGEIPWRVLAQLSMPTFFQYEERVNCDFFELYPVIGLCLFDMTRFGTEWTLGILRTHPMMLANGRSFQNPSYYQT